MQVPVRITFLEMTEPDQLRPSTPGRQDVEIVHIPQPSIELARSLYVAVGRDWHWTDRLVWSVERWQEYLNRPQLEFWMARVAGNAAGYFELEVQPGGDVLIAYFGLVPEFIGQRLGGWLLTTAVIRGWELGASRIWLHTCTLDHPQALANYLSRGFRAYKEEPGMQTIPDENVDMHQLSSSPLHRRR